MMKFLSFLNLYCYFAAAVAFSAAVTYALYDKPSDLVNQKELLFCANLIAGLLIEIVLAIKKVGK